MAKAVFIEVNIETLEYLVIVRTKTCYTGTTTINSDIAFKTSSISNAQQYAKKLLSKLNTADIANRELQTYIDVYNIG